MLGGQLRQLREASGISRADAGYRIRSSESKISRMELGKVSFRKRDVADLLTMYGITAGEERETLLALAAQCNKPSWWHQFSDAMPPWFQAYMGLEEAASHIRAYEVQFVPGLLQTSAYAEAVLAAASFCSHDERLLRLKLRLARQELLTRPRPPHLWVVLEESVLRRPIGDREVMRGQLEHLRAVAGWPNVTLQVMPFARGAHSAESGAFTLLRFAEAGMPDIAYIEQLSNALYLHRREDVERYIVAMDQLSVSSLQPAESVRLIGDRIRELDAGER